IFVPFYALFARLARSCVAGRDRRKLLARKMIADLPGIRHPVTTRHIKNRRGLSRFCVVRGAKWDCPLLRGGFWIGSKPDFRSARIRAQETMPLGDNAMK